MKKDFFISYNYKDTKYALWIEQILIDNGYNPIIQALHLTEGTNIGIEINKACNDAEYLIAILSTNYLNSKFTQSEWLSFFKKNPKEQNRKIIPVLIDDNLNIQELLGNLNYIDIPKVINSSNEEELELNIKDLILKEITILTEKKGISKEIKFPFKKKNYKPIYLTKEIPALNETSYFVGREKDLTYIENLLKQDKKIIIINGIAGVGKTETCKKFFREHHNKYTFSGWINYNENLKNSLVTQLNQEITKINPELNFEENYREILKFLIKLDENSLLIIDNASNLSQEELYVLRSFKFKILIISRNQFENVESVSLGFLTENECEEIFYKYYTIEKDNEYVQKIITLVEKHTLTIALSAEAAQNNKTTLKEFYETLQRESYDFKPIISKIFELSNLDDTEIFVLTNLCILPYKEISFEHIKRWLEIKEESLNSLIEKGWLEKQGTNVIMPKVIQKAVKLQTKPDAKKCANLIRNLGEEFNLKPGETYIYKTKFIDFGKAVLDNFNEENVSIAMLSNNIAMIYKAKGDYDKALEFALKTIEISEKLLKIDDPNLATSYDNIASIYTAKGDNNRALKFALKAIEIIEKALDANHPDLATYYNNIATIYQAIGDYDKALQFILESIKITETVFKADHIDLATYYDNIASIYQDMGEYNKALGFALKAIEISEKILETDHPNLATYYNNIATIYKSIGYYQIALEFTLKAIEISEKILETDDPNLATYYNNIAKIYQYTNHYEKFLQFKNKYLEINKINKALSKDAEVEEIKEAIDICEKNDKFLNKLAILQSLNENKLLEFTEDIYINKENKKALPEVIKSFTIKNFQCIKDMELKGIPVDSNWIFITGENGDGKTSLLQALAFGLLGQDNDNNQLLQKETKIKVELKNENRNFTNKLYYKIDNWNKIDICKNVVGYGVYRLDMQSSSIKEEKHKENSAFSLFNEGEGNLYNLETWFKNEQLKKSNRLEKVRKIILQLLPSVEDIIFEDDKVYYLEKGFKSSFKQLSSGNKSIIAMLGDMIIRLLANHDDTTDINELKGIVFIDELDLHLHPCWQKELPQLLTKMFPKIQFWTTTHSIVPFMGAPKNSLFLKITRNKEIGTKIDTIDMDISNISPNILVSSPLFDVSLLTKQNQNPSEFNTHKDYESLMEDKKIDEELQSYTGDGVIFDDDFFN